MIRNLSSIQRVAAIIIGGATILCAQSSQTVSVSGQVVDKKGAAIEGATVRLTSAALQGVRTFRTDAEGKFGARLLPPGAYTIEVSKEGYQLVRLQQAIGLGQTYSPKIQMGSVASAVVEVSEALPSVDKAETSSATNFKMDAFVTLPTGRQIESMLDLAPGVVDSTRNTVNGEQVRGSMSTNNRFTVDGQEVSDSIFGSRGVSLVDEAIDEVQVITGAIPAEYGDVDGGVINAVTKSGGNEFHGSLKSFLQDSGWRALRPMQDKASIIQKLNHTDSFTLGGYILKDKLWFFVAAQDNKTSTPMSLGSGSPFSGAGYNYTDDDKRLQAKFTYAINQDHTLSFAFTTHYENETGRDYGAGDLLSLVPQINQDSYWNLTYLANWTSSLSMEAKIGRKKERLTGGGLTGGPDPLYDLNTSLFYTNGIFNQGDGGDNRDNKSADIKFSTIFSAAGNHTLDFGGNFLQCDNSARNDVGPNSRLIYASDIALDSATGMLYGYPMAIGLFETSTATASTKSTGLFVNDRWSLNDRLTLNLGLRWDHFLADNTQNSLKASSSGWSPRLGMKWDIFGDSIWQVGASFCRYNAKPLANILRAVSNSGSPTEIDYWYVGPVDTNGYATATQMHDLTNYDLQNPFSYSNPSLNVRFDPGLHAPHTDEYQISVSRSWRTAERSGFVKATAVKKDYKDLFNYRVGNDGTVTAPAPYGAVTGPIYEKVWENDPDAKREYKDLELEGGMNTGAWDLGGNITWSSLKGNYQGEGSYTPGSGASLHNFTVQDGVTMYDSAHTSPYGYLIGHQPLRWRLNGDYHFDSMIGKTTIGLIYRFDSAAHDSATRDAPLSAFNPDLSPQASSYGTLTQYRNDSRGDIVYYSSAYTDLALTQDFSTFAVAGAHVAAFVRLTVYNLFNHQQQLDWQNAWHSVADNGHLSDPWVPYSQTGQPVSPSNYATARNLDIQVGFKF